MIELNVLKSEGIIQVKVLGKLEESDFKEKIGPIADDMIDEQGRINGLILDVTNFAGWDGLPALLEHFRFVRHHHIYVKRVAVLGDKTWQDILPRFAQLFVNAQIRYFGSDRVDAAETWVNSTET
jgi:dihydrofolate reductase